MSKKQRIESMQKWIILILISGLLQTCAEPNLNTHQHYPPDSNLVPLRQSSYPSDRSESDHDDRENWQKPQLVISRLGDLSDKTVADIGAGTGYFTIRLARKSAKVIAIDIDQQFLEYIDRQMNSSRDREQLNVETRLTQPDNPSLAPEEADLVLIVNTISYISNRVEYLKKVYTGMSQNSRLVIIDFRSSKLPVGPPPKAKIPADLIRNQLDSAGFGPVDLDTTSLTYQYTLTAYKSK